MEPLENVTAFQYLGRVLTAVYNDWISVVGNLGKARNRWGRLSRIMSQEEVDPKVSGHFYKAVAQVVLLLGEETWVLTPRMERALDSFQHRVAQRITGRQRSRRGGWELGLPAIGVVNGGSRLRGDHEIRH